LEEELKKFNGLASAYEVVSCSTLSGTYLAECLLCDPDFACELSDVDAAFLCLQSRIGGSRMRPILGKLFGQFSPLNPVEDWDQALSEILTFARFESLGVLHSIGWPSDFAGDHPPFNFAINIQGNILAGDVKPANGSGYRLLEADLRKCVSERAAQSGIADPCVTIRYRGPLTQEIVGPNRRLAISDFELQIANKPLSEPQSFILTIGSTRVTVIVGETKELGGGMTGTSVFSDALAPTLKSHMESKGRSADNYDVPLLLAYVRLPGRGAADLKTHASFGDTLSKACKILEGGPISNWLGTLFLCPGTPDTESRFYEGSNAAWPTGLSAKSLSQDLGAALTPLPCFLEDIHEGKKRFSISDKVWRDDAD
jgi:hypothetical protein